MGQGRKKETSAGNNATFGMNDHHPFDFSGVIGHYCGSVGLVLSV